MSSAPYKLLTVCQQRSGRTGATWNFPTRLTNREWDETQINRVAVRHSIARDRKFQGGQSNATARRKIVRELKTAAAKKAPVGDDAVTVSKLRQDRTSSPWRDFKMSIEKVADGLFEPVEIGIGLVDV